MTVPLRKRSGSRWEKVRQRIIDRDQGLCQSCLRNGYYNPGSEVDHIKSLEDGGTDADANLELLCTPCHRKKTARDRGYRKRVRIGFDGWPVVDV